MGTLTDDMSRLSGEIGALRSARHTLMEDLRDGFESLRDGVEETLADIHGARMKMAKRTRADLGAFVSDLQDKVSNLRHVTAVDLAGAHTAFFGSHASRKPTAGSKRSRGKR